MPKQLLQQSEQARRAYLAEEGARIHKLAESGQNPNLMFIGCCDSRVVAEGILGAHPGDVFVVRNVANIVPPAGSEERSVEAAVEFAIGKLGVAKIVVCGHTDCGGIRALQAGTATGAVADWLRHAQPALTRLPDDSESHLALVEANVLVQLGHLAGYSSVIEAVAATQLKIFGWVFDLYSNTISYCEQGHDQFRTFSQEDIGTPSR